MLLLLLAINAASHSPHLSPSYPVLDDVWKSPVSYVLLLTLVIILFTAVVLHFLSSSDPSLTLLHKYKFRHDGYLSLSPSRCIPSPLASLTSFTSPSTHRTLRVLRLLPIPRPGNALPSPIHPRAILIWLPPLHSHVTHSTSLLSHAAYTGHTTLAIDWMRGGGGAPWTWESVVEEVGDFTAETQKEWPATPLFIGGESFGASLALATAIKHPRGVRRNGQHTEGGELIVPRDRERLLTWGL